MFKNFHSVRGKFEFTSKREFPTTVGIHTKGGMYKNNFEMYLIGSIIPFYPDSKEMKGKRFLFKIYSGPGRLNTKTVERLRNLGFIYILVCKI